MGSQSMLINVLPFVRPLVISLTVTSTPQRPSLILTSFIFTHISRLPRSINKPLNMSFIEGGHGPVGVRGYVLVEVLHRRENLFCVVRLSQ